MRKESAPFNSLDIQITSHHLPISCYRIYTVPLPVRSESDHMTVIKNVPNSFAISVDKKYHSELNEEDILYIPQLDLRHYTV